MKKKNVFKIAILPLSILAWGGNQVLGQKPTAPRPFEISFTENDPGVISDLGRISERTGLPLSLYNLDEPTQGATPEDRARYWLTHNRARLGLQKEDLSDLIHVSTRTSEAGSTVRFQQIWNGIPVYHGDIALSMNPRGRVNFVMNQYRPDLELEGQPILDASQARGAAHGFIGIQGPLQYDQTKLMILEKDGVAHWVFQVRVVGDQPIGDWEALVDGQTGYLYKLQDVSCYAHHPGEPHFSGAQAGTPVCAEVPPPPAVNATGNGFAYDADPLSFAAVAYAGAYVDGADATNASLDAVRSAVTLNNITLSAGTYSLVGPYAQIQDFEAPNKGLFTQASSNFSFNRNADAFEAVNTYYHLDKSLSYINATLGIACMPFQYVGGLKFDPSGLSGADNSHYVGSTGRIAFGEGGVDDAEDSDVILHELGHGIHDWITNGNLSQVNGLSEGCGDYWAQSYSRSLGQWTSAQPAYQWVFNWDGHNPFWGGRITNYAALYPGGLVGQIHTDGQIWSTCMMKIWDAIGKDHSDRAFLLGLAMTNASSSQQDAAIAVRQAAINMGFPAGEINTISTLLAGCGYVLPAILPVEMGYFNGIRVNSSTNQLAWNTLREESNRGFSIERKREGESDFSQIGFVESAGQVEGAGYTYQDPQAGPSMAWYRIRQMDQNGDSHLSEVIEISGMEIHSLVVTVAPNPLQGALRAHLSLPGEGVHSVSIQIADLAGKTMISKGYTLTGLQSELEVAEAQDLAPGSYLLTLIADGESQTLKFQVMK